jgi:hypothetical protein
VEDRIVTQAPEKLVGSYVKLRRAEQLCRELSEAIDEFAQSKPYEVQIVQDGDGWQQAILRVRATPDPVWGAIYGDAASSIRAALDYLANALTLLSGNPREDCSFPVYKREAEFDKNARKKLPGVGQEHIRLLREVQPFHDQEPAEHPLAQMQLISNADKHRKLQPAFAVPREAANNLALTLSTEQLELAVKPGPVTDGDPFLAARATPAVPILAKGSIVLDVGFGDRLLTIEHLRNAMGYALWVISRVQLSAWGPGGWVAPDEMGQRRVPSGVPSWSAEVVVHGIDTLGHEVTKTYEASPISIDQLPSRGEVPAGGNAAARGSR